MAQGATMMMMCQWQSEPASGSAAAFPRQELDPLVGLRSGATRPSFAVRSVQGRRSYQEDTYDVRIDLLGSLASPAPSSHGSLPGSGTTPLAQGAQAGTADTAGSFVQQQGPPLLSFAAVYDGHGGSAVAQHCAERLAPILRNHLMRRCNSSGSSSSGDEGASGGGSAPVSPASSPSSSPTCSPAQQLCRGDGSVQDDVLGEALVRSFEDCDACIPQALASEGGSTAVCAVLGPDAIWVANCGDSRAMVARRGALAVALSDDHKPERPDETERIRAAGGHVFWNGGHRVMGVLSMTRAMGDQYLKQYGVICTPEVMRVDRTPEDEFLLLASDGLWAALSNAEAVGVAAACVERAQARGADRPAALRVAAQVLVKAALQQGSSDNITVVLVDLKTPTPTQSHPAVWAPEQQQGHPAASSFPHQPQPSAIARNDSSIVYTPTSLPAGAVPTLLVPPHAARAATKRQPAAEQLPAAPAANPSPEHHMCEAADSEPSQDAAQRAAEQPQRGEEEQEQDSRQAEPILAGSGAIADYKQACNHAAQGMETSPSPSPMPSPMHAATLDMQQLPQDGGQGLAPMSPTHDAGVDVDVGSALVTALPDNDNADPSTDSHQQQRQRPQPLAQPWPAYTKDQPNNCGGDSALAASPAAPSSWAPCSSSTLVSTGAATLPPSYALDTRPRPPPLTFPTHSSTNPVAGGAQHGGAMVRARRRSDGGLVSPMAPSAVAALPATPPFTASTGRLPSQPHQLLGLGKRAPADGPASAAAGDMPALSAAHPYHPLAHMLASAPHAAAAAAAAALLRGHHPLLCLGRDRERLLAAVEDDAVCESPSKRSRLSEPPPPMSPSLSPTSGGQPITTGAPGHTLFPRASTPPHWAAARAVPVAKAAVAPASAPVMGSRPRAAQDAGAAGSAMPSGEQQAARTVPERRLSATNEHLLVEVIP